MLHTTCTQDMAGPTTSGRELVRGLAIRHSHPNWLVTRWIKQFGREQAEVLMAHNNRVPVHCLRVNTLGGLTAQDLLQKVEELGGRAESSSLLPMDFIRLETGLQAVLAAVSANPRGRTWKVGGFRDGNMGSSGGPESSLGTHRV